MKALNISVAFHAADNYALFAVELIIGRIEAHQIAYLHHTYSIAQEASRVKDWFCMST